MYRSRPAEGTLGSRRKKAVIVQVMLYACKSLEVQSQNFELRTRLMDTAPSSYCRELTLGEAQRLEPVVMHQGGHLVASALHPAGWTPRLFHRESCSRGWYTNRRIVARPWAEVAQGAFVSSVTSACQRGTCLYTISAGNDGSTWRLVSAERVTIGRGVAPCSFSPILTSTKSFEGGMTDVEPYDGLGY